MAHPLHCVVTTPEGRLLEEEVDQITVETIDGQITVLPDHIPLVTILRPGEMLLRTDSKTVSYALYGGFLEIRPESKIFILADAAERPELIDLQAAEAARERARHTLQEKFDTAEYEDAALQLERELTRVRLARKHHRRHKGGQER